MALSDEYDPPANTNDPLAWIDFALGDLNRRLKAFGVSSERALRRSAAFRLRIVRSADPKKRGAFARALAEVRRLVEQEVKEQIERRGFRFESDEDEAVRRATERIAERSQELVAGCVDGYLMKHYRDTHEGIIENATARVGELRRKAQSERADAAERRGVDERRGLDPAPGVHPLEQRARFREVEADFLQSRSLSASTLLLDRVEKVLAGSDQRNKIAAALVYDFLGEQITAEDAVSRMRVRRSRRRTIQEVFQAETE